jgi:hypothetical protein
MEPELLRCKCNDCSAGNHSRMDCLNNKCQCCDMEDMFALLSRIEPTKEFLSGRPRSATVA